MRIQVSSDSNIKVGTRAIAFVRGEANRALKRYRSKLTRLEFYLSDLNSFKSGPPDKRCLVEARPAGQRPIAVAMTAATARAAVVGSLSKLQTALERSFGRLQTRAAGGG